MLIYMLLLILVHPAQLKSIINVLVILQIIHGGGVHHPVLEHTATSYVVYVIYHFLSKISEFSMCVCMYVVL